MFKDDRLISILSGVVLMAAIGMIVQKGDVLQDLFDGGSDNAQLNDDEIVLNANDIVRIDVLANDTGITSSLSETLRVVDAASCGETIARDGRITFAASNTCNEFETIRYSVGADDDALTAEVRIRIAAGRDEVFQTFTEDANQGEEDERIAAVDPTAEAPARARARGDRRNSSAAEPVRRVLAPSNLSAPIGSEDTALAPLPMPAPSRPNGLGESAQDLPGAGDAPSRAAAPSAVGAPERRLPGTIGAPRPLSDRNVDVARVDAENVPAGLFGSGRRASTSAAPDPSRPAPSQSVRTLLAMAPQPLARQPETAPSQRPRSPRFEVATEQGAPRVSSAVPGRLTPVPGADLALNAPALRPSAPLAPGRPLQRPENLQNTASLSLARTESYASPQAPRVGSSPSRLGAGVPRVNPVRIGGSQDTMVALAAPTSGLGDVLNLQRGRNLTPVDTSVPAGLTSPIVEDIGMQTASLDTGGFEDSVATEVERAAENAREDAPTDDTERSEGVPVPAPRPGRAVEQAQRTAAVTPAAADCAIAPGITVDARPAARTTLALLSPCHARSIAELRYSGLRIAVPLDAEGRGRLDVLGFEPRAEAVLWFTDGTETEFTLPFSGADRLNRVALVWDLPVAMELHAVENGAQLGSSGHVHPGNAKSFDDVRRRGGGYLNSYASIGGIGQNMQIYSHWRRRGDDGAIVKMMIDYTSRQRDRLAGTCGTGPYAAPAFTVVRSENGRMDRPLNRRLGALDCRSVPEATTFLIEAAVDDLIISNR
ncbi:MAG: hypothetical protein AAGI34_06985 [Pseudomonadota bacterium]